MQTYKNSETELNEADQPKYDALVHSHRVFRKAVKVPGCPRDAIFKNCGPSGRGNEASDGDDEASEDGDVKVIRGAMIRRAKALFCTRQLPGSN